MVLIDRAVSYRDDFIHCQVEINDNSPFCENGTVPSYIGLEYMAQTIAVWNGIMSRHQDIEPKIGFLVGTRRLDLNLPYFKVGEVLNVYGKTQFMDGEMASFECWIDVNGKRASSAGLNVYQPNDITNFLSGEINGS